jgi:hypothetical protein
VHLFVRTRGAAQVQTLFLSAGEFLLDEVVIRRQD